MSVDVELTDDELCLLAAGGSTVAAGELLARLLPTLTMVARRLAVPSIDSDDLLGDAMANLLGAWSKGKGPRDRAVAYLVRSMKNRVTDELRSPRSRNVPLMVDAEPVIEPVEYHRAEIHRELSVVRMALNRLPEDQRIVLTTTIVDGRKPGDLTDELDRGPGAVYALLHRARQALQRSVLQVLIEQEGGESCSHKTRHLPRVITPELVDESSTPDARHMAGCAHCGRAWQRYLGMLAGCGIAGLAVVVGTGFASAPPAAAAVLDAGLSERHSSSQTTTSPKDQSPRRRRRLVGAVVLVVGTCVAIGGVVASRPGTASAEATPQADFSVQLNSPQAQQTDVDVHIHVDHPWTVQSLTFAVPQKTSLASAPTGWTCTYPSSQVVDCSTGRDSDTGGRFTFTTGLTGEAARLEVALKATAGSVPVTATSDSDFPY